MRLVIEARVESADAATQQKPILLAVIERVDVPLSFRFQNETFRPS
jgi:hypothetical protein